MERLSDLGRAFADSAVAWLGRLVPDLGSVACPDLEMQWIEAVALRNHLAVGSLTETALVMVGLVVVPEEVVAFDVVVDLAPVVAAVVVQDLDRPDPLGLP